VKGGLPLTATSDTGREVGRYTAQTSFQLKRYTVGPTVEIGLPWHLRLEADALYKHVRQDRFSGPAPSGTLIQQSTRAGIWEIPLLLKYRWDLRGYRPFVTAGSTLRRVGELDIEIIQTPTFPGYQAMRYRHTVSSGEPVRVGVTLGGGLSWGLRVLRLEPELRYTHWTSKHWMATREQLEFLLGLRLPLW
jgi:hypothetical protein